MALTTTTLNGAVGVNDTTIRVTSGSSFGKGKWIRVDDEMMLQSADADTASTTIIPVVRGQNATVNAAHVTTTNVTMGDGTDFAGTAVDTANAYPLAGRQRRVTNYAASGAITLPSPGTDAVAILIGTGTLAMTVASPTKDMDGCVLWVGGTAKSASTITVNDGTTGIGNAGSGYDVLTLQTAGNVVVEMIAINGFWCVPTAAGITGTVTGLTAAIA